MTEGSSNISIYFADLEDPRANRGNNHSLHNILVMTICAVVCNCDNWVEVADFAEIREDWFRSFLDLPEQGTPSHDTFGRVFSMLDPQQFAQCFATWAQALANRSKAVRTPRKEEEGQEPTHTISIDGKSVRRSFDRASEKSAIHMIQAWAVDQQIIVGQLKTEDKSNEITAIPKLLELLDIKKKVVTIDAMGCQTAISKKIVDQGGDYIFSLKGNQGHLNEEVKVLFETAETDGFKDIKHDTYEFSEKGHGREETRRCVCMPLLDVLEHGQDFKKLTSVAKVEATRKVGKKLSRETRYFISSLDGEDAQRMARCIRAHWEVENTVHWSLDVTFSEDQSRVRIKNAAANFATIRRIALNLLKQETTKKVGIKAKRKAAGWSDDYLFKVLGI